MKKSKLFGWAFVAMCFVACSSNETEEILNQEREIKLTSSITPLTRVTDQNLQSTQIVSGQQIGVTIINAKSEHKNVGWAANSSGNLTNTGSTIYYGDGQATIYAYHPYNSSWSGTDKAETFSVSTDQSSNSGYLNSDLLWATKTASKSNNPVALTFAHKLVKINMTLTSDDINDLSNATIYVCGTNIATKFNPFTGSLSAATTTNISDIKAGVTTNSTKVASAIIIPQTVANGTQLIKVVLNNKEYYYTLDKNQEFKAGSLYNYTITIKQEKSPEITITPDNIIDWTDQGNNSGNAIASGSDMEWND